MRERGTGGLDYVDYVELSERVPVMSWVKLNFQEKGNSPEWSKELGFS